jgi:hypothetical protein
MMSVKVLSKVWESYPGGGTDLLALLALADWSDDEGRSYPSIKSIAKKIRLKERQAQRAVNKLIKDGFVKILSNKFGGAPGSTRNYQIIIGSLTGVPDDTPKHKTGVMQDADGCHITPETGVTDDTQTVIEPSLTVRQKTKAKITLSLDGNFKNLEDHLVVWKNAYPNLDVMTEIRKAGSWCISNPKRCPKSNFPRFLNGWLSRSNSTPSESIMDGVL